MFRLDHIGLVTKNIEELAHVFRTLGLNEITESLENPRQKVAASFVNVGGREDVYVEILEPTRNDSPITKFLEKQGGGLHHLCFEVNDIKKTSLELVEKGFKMIVPPEDCEAYDENLKRECNDITKIAFFIVSDRLLIELIEKG
jgi:methylmalonyl-CoA/ethylmalonyl-CoA epimerase